MGGASKRMTKKMKVILLLVSLLVLSGIFYGIFRPKWTQKHQWEPYVELTQSPQIAELSPEEMLEYMELFGLRSNKTKEAILNGQQVHRLYSTTETAVFLEQFNLFTCGLHGVSEESRITPGKIVFVTTGAYIEEDFSPAEVYRLYKSLPEEIVQRIHTRIDGLTLKEYILYMNGYGLLEENETKSIYEYDGSTPAFPHPTHTQGKIDRLNDALWNTEAARIPVSTVESLSLRRSLAQEYGLSSENPVTVDWILENPQKAYGIIEPFDQAIFPDRTRILKW